MRQYPSGRKDVATEELLEYYYIGGEDIVRSFKVFEAMDQYDMDEFHNLTASTFTIEDCQFGPNGINYKIELENLN